MNKMRNETIEKYRAILFDVYSSIQKGDKINFLASLGKQQPVPTLKSLLMRAGFISETEVKDVYSWEYKFPNGVKDWYVASRSLLDWQNDNNRMLRDKRKQKAKKAAMKNDLIAPPIINTTPPIQSNVPELDLPINSFNLPLTKFEGKALMLLLAEVVEEDDFVLYHKYIERISAKLFDKIF